MGHLMVVKVAGCCESLSTNPTLVRLFSTVNSPEKAASTLKNCSRFLRLHPPVCIETGAGGKAFVANVANMRLFSRVGSHVPFQQAGPVKSLSTDGARKHGLLPGSPEGKQYCYG